MCITFVKGTDWLAAGFETEFAEIAGLTMDEKRLAFDLFLS
jgi:hypothetical protein